METSRPAVVLLAAVVVFFTCLGRPYLWDEDEPKNAACAREMLEAGNWVVPQFNYQLRTDKPILLYWLMMASYSVFGVGEFGARCVSATLSVGTVLLTFGLGRRLYRPEVGQWAGLAMAGCLMFAAGGRAATPDGTLIFCTTLALYLFVRYGGVVGESLTRGGYVATYGAMALAVLAKGPVGVVLPGGILGLFLLCRRQQTAAASAAAPGASFVRRAAAATFRTLAPRRIVAAAWSLRPLTALAVLAVVALPWYVLVGLRTDGAWLAGFLGRHNVDRFTGSLEGHGGSIFYYPLAVMIGFFPWSCFLPLAVYRLARRLASPGAVAERAADTFLACWAGLYLSFFTLAGTKLPSYVLPAYPALAVMTGVLVDEWLRGAKGVSAGWFRTGLAVPAVVGGAFIVALPIVAPRYLPDDGWLGIVGLPLIGGALACLWLERRRRALVPLVFAASATLFVTSLLGGAAWRVSRHATSPAVMAEARSVFGDEARLIGFRHFEPTLAFYAGSEVPFVYSEGDLAAALARAPQSCLVTRGELLGELADTLGEPPQIVARYPRVLRGGGEIVVVRPPATFAAAVMARTTPAALR